MLEMQLHLPRHHVAVFPTLRLPVFSEDGDDFRAGDPSLFVPADLEQLVDPASIGECNHGKGSPPQNAAVEALWLNDQLGPTLCCPCEPVISGTQQTSVGSTTSIGETISEGNLPAFLIVIGMGVLVVKPLAQAMLNQVSKPQQIGSRTIKLQEKTIALLVQTFARRRIPNDDVAVATPVMLHPGPLVPQDELQQDFSGLNARLCNRPGIAVDLWDGLGVLKMVGQFHFACLGEVSCLPKSPEHPLCRLFAKTNLLT